MIFNADKTYGMTFTFKRKPIPQPPLYFDNTALTEITEHTHLGLTLSSDLSWKPHANRICFRAGQRNNILRKLKFRLPRKTLEKLYTSLFRPILEYGDVLFDDGSITIAQKIESVQLAASRTCTGALITTNCNNLLQ